MSEKNESEISVLKASPFTKTFKKLSKQNKELVEDEIDLIIENPEIGEQKKGDLSHLRVHKFSMNRQQVLLGYSWLEEQLEIWLLNIGPHENFYDKVKNRRDVDLSAMGKDNNPDKE